MSLRDLPPEMVEEVISKLDPVSVAKLIGSSRSLHKEHGGFERTEALREMHEKQRTQDQIAEVAYRSATEFSTDEPLYLASEKFTKLLGPNITTLTNFPGQVLITEETVSGWLLNYYDLNGMSPDDGISIVVDKTLVDLMGAFEVGEVVDRFAIFDYVTDVHLSKYNGIIITEEQRLQARYIDACLMVISSYLEAGKPKKYVARRLNETL